MQRSFDYDSRARPKKKTPLEIPVLVDSVKVERDFEMTRCTIFVLETERAGQLAAGTHLELASGMLEGRSGRDLQAGLAFYDLHLRGAVVQSLDGGPFHTPLDIQDLLDTAERYGLSIEADELWLPTAPLTKAKAPELPEDGDVFRITEPFFQGSLRFGAGEFSLEDWMEELPQGSCRFSPEETEAFRDWHEEEVEEARSQYPKSAALALEWRPGT